MPLPIGRIGWPRSAHHAKGHAIVLAVLIWAAAAVVSFVGSGDRGIAGPLKGADFVHFYTLGHLASAHRTEALYDPTALHQAQAALVPDSALDFFPTVYPPQAAMLFAPFAGWSYRGALLFWSLLTIAVYGLIVWSVWRRFAAQLPDRTLVLVAAAAFPPFWSLILYGQITIVILIAFWAGWLALERRRPYLAGLAFGVLALKPQFGIPLAAIVLACGEWSMLAGALSSVLVQAAAVWLVLGSSVFWGFAGSLSFTITNADWLEQQPFMSHSLRVITRLLPAGLSLPVWAAIAALVLWQTVRVWKSHAPASVRLGVVILASVLVNPHVIIYDVTVLALSLIWFAAYMQEPARASSAAAFGTTVYWLCAFLFIPTAAAIGLQISVFVMAWLLILVSRAVHASASTETQQPLAA